MDWSTKTYESSKKKNWQEKNRKRKTLKAASTKTETKSEEVDDSKSVFSDITFTVATASDIFQAHSVSDTISIPEDPTIKGIFPAAGAQMQVSADATPSDIDTITNWYSQIPGIHASQKGGYSYLPRSKFILNECIENFKFYVWFIWC